MFRNSVIAMFVLCIMCAASGAAAQEGVSQEKAAADQQKAMQAYEKLMAKNENHAFLGNFAGEWDITTTVWMTPGAEPVKNTGTCSAELVLGGRYLLMKYRGTMFGQPFEGIQITGYDNAQKKYTTFWIDNTGTGFYFMSGVRNEKTNAIEDTGLWPDPLTGGTSKVRDVTRLVSADEFVYELYMIGADGAEFKSLENRATRKK